MAFFWMNSVFLSTCIYISVAVSTCSLRAAPLVRAKVKITVKTPYARSLRQQQIALLAGNLAFPLTSGAARSCMHTSSSNKTVVRLHQLQLHHVRVQRRFCNTCRNTYPIRRMRSRNGVTRSDHDGTGRRRPWPGDHVCIVESNCDPRGYQRNDADNPGALLYCLLDHPISPYMQVAECSLVPRPKSEHPSTA